MLGDVRGARRRGHACGRVGRRAPDLAEREEACLEDARYLISFLPQNNVDPPPYAEPSDPAAREDAELDTLIPDDPAKPYDMKEVVRHIVDDGEFMEVHERWAENLVCGFARLNGYPVGVVGNQPRALAGVLDIDSSAKGARFVRTCGRTDDDGLVTVYFVQLRVLLKGFRSRLRASCQCDPYGMRKGVRGKGDIEHMTKPERNGHRTGDMLVLLEYGPGDFYGPERFWLSIVVRPSQSHFLSHLPV